MTEDIKEITHNNEITKSIKNNIYEKITSPLWWTFIITWLVWNWQLTYTTIFVSWDKIYEKYEILKIEYIIEKIYDWSYHFFTLPIIVDYITYWFIWPILSTIIILWFIPYISNFVYIRDTKLFKKDRILAKDKMEIEVLKEKNRLLKEEKKEINTYIKEKEKIINKKEKIEEKEENLENKEYKKWDEEYNSIIKKYKDLITKLETFIYEHKWHINNYDWNRQLDTELEKILDSNWIIKKIEKEENWWAIYTLTEKWKYFLKKSTLE